MVLYQDFIRYFIKYFEGEGEGEKSVVIEYVTIFNY